MPEKNLMTDLLKKEAERLAVQSGKFVYSSKPYSCGLSEALVYFRDMVADPARTSIERTPEKTIITIKPIRGSGKRKPLVITLWTA